MTDKERVKRCAALAEEEAELWADRGTLGPTWYVVYDQLCAALRELNGVERLTYNNYVDAN